MKAVVLIDGNYLYKSASEAFGSNIKPKYPDCAFNIFHHYRHQNELQSLHLLRVRYHDSGACDENSDFSRKKQKFLDSLKSNKRFDVILGRCRKLGSEYTQKGVDVNIAIDIIRYSLYVDTLILISGDSDLIPAIELAKDRGSEIVVYISPHHKIIPGSSIDRLIKSADDYYLLDKTMLTMNHRKFLEQLSKP